MCQVKTGVQIKSLTDVQNVVTASILRSHVPFSIPVVSATIINSCRGSSLPLTDSQITAIVKETTNALLRSRYITTKAGFYYACPSLSDE